MTKCNLAYCASVFILIVLISGCASFDGVKIKVVQTIPIIGTQIEISKTINFDALLQNSVSNTHLIANSSFVIDLEVTNPGKNSYDSIYFGVLKNSQNIREVYLYYTNGEPLQKIQDYIFKHDGTLKPGQTNKLRLVGTTDVLGRNETSATVDLNLVAYEFNGTVYVPIPNSLNANRITICANNC